MIANQPSDTFFAWPEDAVAELKRLDERGDSSSQIANALSAKFQRDITRNAVIGKRMRLGLQRSDAWRKANMQAVSERESARRDKETQRIRRVTEREAARLAKLARLQADHKPNSKENNVILLSTRIHPDAFATAPKVMMDPCYRGCKWPLERRADNGDMLFCCNETPDPLDTYCPDHKRRAYQRTRTPAQIAADEAHREARIVRARAMGLKQGLRTANTWGLAR